MIVEENEADAELLLLMLHRALPEVRLRTRGTLAEALEVLDERPVELVFLALGLPDAEEFEGLTKLRRVDETMAIVMLTDVDDEELASRALHAGAQDYLVKGHVPQDVIKRTVRYAL
ncbi:MAG: response regulator, partial [Myxococcota bacterium]